MGKVTEERAKGEIQEQDSFEGGGNHQEVSMAANFRIFTHLNSENLHLKLVGDFDERSARAVLNALKAYGQLARKIFIHTSDLGQVDPAAREIFKSSFLDFKTGRNRVIRTGGHDIGIS
jgi:hypothetical protein